MSEAELLDAAAILRTAAEDGIGDAQHWYAWMLASGVGIPQDYSAAVKWYEEAIAQDIVQSHVNLGLMYYQGRGVAQDKSEAAKLYRFAADNGDKFSQRSLGDMYRFGDGISQDLVAARTWLLAAAEQGEGEAQNSLGWMHYYGEGGSIDYSRARFWFVKASDHAIADAYNGLGVLYHYGYGVDVDAQRAADYYYPAAFDGNMYAQHNLGVLFADPPGDYRHSEDEAIKWLTAARDQGHPDSQGILDWVYGREAAKDVVGGAILGFAGALLFGDTDPECEEVWPGQPPVCPDEFPDHFYTPTPAPPTPIPTYPDLRINGVVPDPPNPSLLQPVTISIEVENIGDGVARNVAVSLVDSEEQFPPASHTIRTIQPGEFQTIALSVFNDEHPFQLGATEIRLTARVDVSGDSDTTNNFALYDHPAHLKPDMIVSKIVASPDLNIFRKRTVTVSIENIGEGSAWGVETIGGAWSLVTRIQYGDAADDKILRGQPNEISVLAPGHSQDIMFSIPGDYVGAVTADVDFVTDDFSTEFGLYIESDEDNNALTTEISQ